VDEMHLAVRPVLLGRREPDARHRPSRARLPVHRSHGRRTRVARDDRQGRLIRKRNMQNRSIPSATVIPELAYAEVRAAAAWLCDALGFSERLRIANHRIQLTRGDSALVVIEGPSQPDPAHASTHVIMLRVVDLDAVFARALARGAEALRQPTDYPYG